MKRAVRTFCLGLAGAGLGLLALTAAAQNAAGPATPAAGAKVHIAEGMWSQHWKLPEALKDRYQLTESFLCSRYGPVTSLKGFPMKKEDLFANRALILANIPLDAFLREGSWQSMRDAPGRSEAWVEEFLAQGGGVLVLGGNYSLGIGGTLTKPFTSASLKGTAFERFLPAEIHEADIVFEKQNKPVELVPAGKHPILEGVDWSGKPVTMFYHEVVPRPGTEVLVKAGDAPILIAGTYKGGRIVLWTATLHGEPPAGKTAYWRWAGWPRLMQNVTAWLAAGNQGGNP